jgi:antitoxin HicB
VSADNPHWGATLEDFLSEEGIRETARTEALIRVVAWSLAQEMERQGLTKAAAAERMETRAGAKRSSRRRVT